MPSRTGGNMRLIFPTLVLLCLFPVSALTQPSPPPAPEKEAAIAAASCGGARDVGKGEQVPVVAEPAPVSLLGGKDGKVGALSFDWGVQLSARDPRFGGIVGLTFDDRLGIVAITDQGNWIVLDMQQGHTPKSVGISAMRGVGGAPAAILGAGQAQLVSVPGRNMVARYDLRDCGLNATAVPIAQTNVGVQAMATVAYGYTLFVGASNGGTVNVVRDFNGLDPLQAHHTRPARSEGYFRLHAGVGHRPGRDRSVQLARTLARSQFANRDSGFHRSAALQTTGRCPGGFRHAAAGPRTRALGVGRDPQL